MFTMEELVDNYVTFLVAGGDPTAHTITFAIYEIVSLSAWQEFVPFHVKSPDIIVC